MSDEIKKTDDKIKGLGSLFIGSALLGLSAIFVRYSDSSPSLIAFYRVFLALPFLYLWVLMEGKGINLRLIPFPSIRTHRYKKGKARNTL